MISYRFQIIKCLHTFVQSKEPLIVKSLQFFRHGIPADVLQIKEEELIATHDNQVLVKILAAPIHPAQVDLIKGEKEFTFAHEEKFPIIPGSECVAEVVSIGEEVKDLSVNQRVIVNYADTISKRGTWSTHALYDAEDLTTIPEDIGIPEAATLSVYPCAAYHILKDFITLKPGDSVLFNSGFSALGQAMHQLCKAWNLHSVSLVRVDTNVKVKDYLKGLGATEVFTVKELLESNIFENGTLPKPRLALSCVARSSSRLLGNYLGPNGIMVTHGPMGGYPAAALTTAFTFKDFVQRPFWITRWNREHPKKEQRDRMFEELCFLIKEKQFRASEMECVPFSEYKYAFNELEKNKGSMATKFYLDMTSEESNDKKSEEKSEKNC